MGVVLDAMPAISTIARNSGTNIRRGCLPISMTSCDSNESAASVPSRSASSQCSLLRDRSRQTGRSVPGRMLASWPRGACCDRAEPRQRRELHRQFDKCAFTVPSAIPSSRPMTLLDLPCNSPRSTEISRSVRWGLSAFEPAGDRSADGKAVATQRMRRQVHAVSDHDSKRLNHKSLIRVLRNVSSRSELNRLPDVVRIVVGRHHDDRRVLECPRACG